MTDGFGVYKSTSELDTLIAKIEATSLSNASMQNLGQGENEMGKLEKLSQEQDIMAIRVIEKFNKNSERILKQVKN